MMVRIDSSAPLAVVKMALEFAAKQGFAVDMVAGNQPRIVRTAKQSEEKAVKPKASKPEPKAPKKAPKAPKEPTSEVPEELRAKANGLRTIAESGQIRLPKEVYGALRSKNVDKLTKAIAEASSLLTWGVTKTESEAHLHAELHKEFMQSNPLLAK